MVVKPTRSVNRTETRRRSAVTGAAGAATSGAGAAAVAKEWPQLAQKRASERFAAPHAGQLEESGAPQLSQNRLPGRFSVPHAAQGTGSSSVGSARAYP